MAIRVAPLAPRTLFALIFAALSCTTSNAATGCLSWSFQAEYPLSTSIAIGVRAGLVYSKEQHGSAYAVLYVNSSYVHIGSVPGNVLLAFALDGR